MELLDPIKAFLTGLADRDQLWIVHAFGVVLATLVLAMVVSFILKRLVKKADKANAIWLMMAFHSVRPPLKGLIWLLGISWASYLTHRGADVDLMGAVETVRKVGIVLLVTWFLVRFIRLGEQEFLYPRKGEPGDPTTVGAVSKLLRASVVITAVLGLLQALGYSISGVLAFGGVGGIAVGFAAKDLLANFFGGLTIYMDRPFAVGDWVRSPDKEIEGVVENIGWRQTRIRTFDRRPLYVPNATFTQISVENPSRMENRRILETIGIRYDDVDKMGDIVADVRQMLLDDERIETDHQTLIVNFNTFAASSLDFFVYTFTKTVNWVEFHEIKQDVMLKIADIIAGYGAEIALPTSTLHVPEPVRLAGRGADASEAPDRDQGKSTSGEAGRDRSRGADDKAASGQSSAVENRSSGDPSYGGQIDGNESGEGD